MRILIVEDEPATRQKTERLVTNLGYDAVTAVDGVDGWEKWQEHPTRIVITDWMMPGMDGLQLCRRIKNERRSQYTYVIMLTAKHEVKDIVTGMDAGADDFITKPFVKDELAVRIRAGERILVYETRDIVIFSLAKLAESRDPDTGHHLERIRHYSRALSEAMAKSQNCPEEIDNMFIETIFLTSPLHDIGKIGIPDHVLLKPGMLNEEESEIMKGHCRIGFKTLNECLQNYPQAFYLKMSAEIAMSHHERFDGTGYPGGLKETEIPLSARIVALADVYDALANKRVYKDAFTLDAVKDMIVNDRGKYFDPMVVDAFLSCQDTFVDIFHQFQEEEK